MEVTNGDIWAATTPTAAEPTAPPPLQELLAQRWPIKTAYWLTRLARSIGGPRADIAEVREKLIRDMGTINDKGQTTIQQGDQNWPEFAAKHNELMAETVVLDIDKISLPMWNGCDVKPTTLFALEPFLDMNMDEPTGAPALKVVQ